MMVVQLQNFHDDALKIFLEFNIFYFNKKTQLIFCKPTLFSYYYGVPNNSRERNNSREWQNIKF